MPPKPQQKFPDFLPNIRIAGPVGRPFPLSAATTHCVLEVPQSVVRQISTKVMLELRVLIAVEVPSTQKDKPMPQSITVGHGGTVKKLANPRWTKLSGFWVHEDPVNVGFLIKNRSDGKSVKLEFDLIIDLLDMPIASGVADVYLSRNVSTTTLIRSVLGADPLPSDMVEERRLNMKDQGIVEEIVSLRCPCLGIRIKTPVRFETCKHLECFDLHNFLKMEEKRPKGRCPVCNKLIEFRTLGVCEFTAKLIESNETCESYRITPESIEPLSPALASETRKRKRGALTSSSNVKPETGGVPVPLPASGASIEAPAPRRRRVQPDTQNENIRQCEAPIPQQTLTESPDYIVID